MTVEDEVSLRPLALRPGGNVANPLASYGKGLGYGKGKKASTSTVDERPPKRNSERVRYPKEFLLKFMEKYNSCPSELEQQNLEIVVSGEDRQAQQEVLQKVAEEIDDRDWRTRTSVGNYREGREEREFREPKARETREPAAEPREARPAAPARAAPARQEAAAAPTPQEPTQQSTQHAPSALVAGVDPEDMRRIAKAADMGRQAYKVGGSLSSEDRAVRSVKGILNKLTPEKFERLLNQLLEVITTADVLQKTIALVFENAVEQPTYVAMYGDLCVSLSKELPHFPPPPGSDKPLSFRQILLNTCQDEFEGAADAREELASISDTAEREVAERDVKKRVLGNMRLMSELYKQDMVKDWIIVTCIDELLTARVGKGKVPPEDNIEAVMEIVRLSGSKLSKSEKPETLKKLDKVLKELERLMNDKTNGVSLRVRLAVKDIMELKKSNWVPRREAYTAKKLDEVRAQAEAELGMISSTIAASLPSLGPSAMPRYGEPMGMGPGGMGGGREEGLFGLIPPMRGDGEVQLFPAFRGDSGSNAFSSAGGKGSALLGDYTPPVERVQLPMRQEVAPTQVVQQEAPRPSRPTPPAPGKPLSDEELTRKAQNLYQEFTNTLDKAEATTCVRELGSQHLAKAVEIGLDQIFNSLKEKEQDALLDLLLHLHEAGAITSENVVDAMTTYTTQLEDLSMDVPKAPLLLGRFYGSCVSRNIASLDLLPQLMEGDASVEPKRRFSGAAFKVLRAAKGDAGLTALCSEVGLTAGTFLAADPEFDKDEPALEEWLKAEGLAGIVPV